MHRRVYLLFSFCLALFSTSSWAQTRTVGDDDLTTGNYTWSSDTTYFLDGFVFLEGGSLTIEAGTVIKGLADPSTNDLASTLIITRGAQIFAEGTAQNPIIFTAEADDVTVSDDTYLTDRGLWGGLILLGNASITDETTEEVVEGLPAEDPRSLYGGSDDTENSGVIRYVSIRHGGAELAPGEEINGLTLGGIGSGTTIEFVEVFANSDDGIEWFGGTVSVKYAAVSYCGDDSYDYDTGWRGKGQFWLSLQGPDDGDNGGEHDGAKPDANTPSSNPVIYNATFIGSGTGSSAKNEHALLFRDGSRGTYANSIFTDFANFALQVEDLASGVDSRQYMEQGELNLLNNIWFGFGNGDEFVAGELIQATEGAEDPNAQFLVDHLNVNSNSITDPLLAGISRGTDDGIGFLGDGQLDPRPAFNGPAYMDLADVPEDVFYTSVDYKGAFGASLWLRGWTALSDQDALPEQQEIVIRDEDLGSDEYTWTSDNTYLLDGFVFLEEGGVLNIEPGTVIKGQSQPSNNDLASTLIITRGAQIFANGTAQNPIIFTAEIDDVNDPDDTFLNDRGLWGGVIILGSASITDETTEEVVEGLPQADPRSLYGGDNDEDNSGSIRFVSIRHGGAELAPGEEINGLTLGGVGSGTEVEFVEVIANSDDGIEWFGGTVSVKYAAVSYCGDDSFDYDTGWRGEGQFWLSLQGPDDGDNGGEHDGAKPDANTPSSNPLIYNATFIGSGTGSSAKNEHALLFRDGSRGTYANSVFTDFANFALQVEDLANGVDSRQYMEAGELNLLNNLWFGFGNGDELVAGELIQVTDGAEDAMAQFLIDHLNNNANTTDDPQLGNISRGIDDGFGLVGDMSFDPRPEITGPAYTSDKAPNPGTGFFRNVDFKGAFEGGRDASWLADWTALDQYNLLIDGLSFDTPLGARGERIVRDEDLVAGGNYTWSADTTYLLDGFVFLETDGTLTIPAGTIIKGIANPSTNDLASTLIITRGAQIFANGTADAPIIFTAEIDDVNDPDDTYYTDRGLWGGLILLGNATITDETTEEVVEGLPAEDPRSLYGGDNDEDNSGVLNFISIRHGGAELAPGEEINGLTLGGVGSGTEIQYVEVLANSDDGIEWFGGTVSVKYAAVSFCGDDSYDYDTGWRGNGQFWLSLQGEDDGDNGGEHDGAKPDANTPSSSPTIYNATFIGSGTFSSAKNEHALLFRDGSRGNYSNSIFTDFANFALQVEDLASGVDSRQYMEQGELILANNLWFDFGNGDEFVAGELIQATDGAEDPMAQFLVDHLSNFNNEIIDPQLGGISRGMDDGIGYLGDGMFDPRPGTDGAAYNTDRAGLPADDFFTGVNFKGAFEGGVSNTWIAGWTAIDQNGLLADGLTFAPPTGVEELVTEEAGYKLVQSMPNPANLYTTINFELPQSASVSLIIYDMTGREVNRVLDNEKLTGGEHFRTISTATLPTGVYVYTLVANGVAVSKQLVVRH